MNSMAKLKYIFLVLLLVKHISADLSLKSHLDSIVDQLNTDKNSTWIAANETKFDEWTFDEVKMLMGAVLPNETTPKLEIIQHGLSKIKIPEEFDARSKWPKCASITEIKDQGSCGSCWAVSSVSVMNDRLCIHSNGRKQARLSVEQVTSCVKGGCSGGTMKNAFEYYKNEGIVTGGDYGSDYGCQAYQVPSCAHHVKNSKLPKCGPYQPTNKCVNHCFTDLKISFKRDKHYGKSVYSVGQSETEIQKEIFQNGPVTAMFVGYADFLTYKSGIYSHKTGEFLGGHAIKLLGWGVENDVKYWLAANSWNTDWGEDGYFRILRGRNECGIEGGVVAGL